MMDGGGLQPVNSFDFRESHRGLGFWSFLQHASLWSSEQSVKQAAFASALGPSCSESAHYSGHHAGMIIMPMQDREYWCMDTMVTGICGRMMGLKMRTPPLQSFAPCSNRRADHVDGPFSKGSPILSLAG